MLLVCRRAERPGVKVIEQQRPAMAGAGEKWGRAEQAMMTTPMKRVTKALNLCARRGKESSGCLEKAENT